MNEFWSVFFHAFASLFSIVNPIGMSSVFLAMTEGYSKKNRNTLAYRVAIYGAILLICTFFVGPYILLFFGISLPNIQVAGGMLVFYTAWKMLDTKPTLSPDEQTDAINTDISFFPLTMPITAGAGSMAVTIALATKNEIHFVAICGFLLAIILVFVMVAFCYRYAKSIFNKLGYTGAKVVTSLSAFILLAISTGIIWEGINGLMTGNHFM